MKETEAAWGDLPLLARGLWAASGTTRRSARGRRDRGFPPAFTAQARDTPRRRVSAVTGPLAPSGG